MNNETREKTLGICDEIARVCADRLEFLQALGLGLSVLGLMAAFVKAIIISKGGDKNA